MRIGVRGRGFDAGGGKEDAAKEIGEIQTGSRQTESRQTESRPTGSRETGSRRTGSRQTGPETGPDRSVQTDQSRPTRWGRSDENRAPPAWECNFVQKNERHAAWERFANMKNESRAAWERICCPYGPGWPPKKDPPKTSQTMCFKLFLIFFGDPLEHPICAHQKMDHPKWTPKSSQGNRTEHLFSGLILQILLFGINLVAAPSMPVIWKINKKHCIYNVSDALAGRNMGHHKEHQKLQNECHAARERSDEKKNERHAAWERFRRLDGPDWSPQKDLPKTAQTICFKLF